MGKGRYLKSAERACAVKARFETAQEAERTCDYRFRAYQCPVCHAFHLTSRLGRPAEESPAPPRPEATPPPGPRLADLDWSSVFDPDRPKPPRTPKPPKPPRAAPLPPADPKANLQRVRCLGPAGKDGRVPLDLNGRLVKSAKIKDSALRAKLLRDVWVWVDGSEVPSVIRPD